jgi:RHS repeat-associated protein
MRPIKNLALPLLVLFAFISVLAYTINISINRFSSFSNSEFLKLSDNPENFQVPADASAMFNERGFYSSNSYSFDENEIIGDYNGNLIYSFPLGYSKGPGDMYLDLKLTYNGSMNYQAMVASLTWANFTNIPQYNFSAPGWVFSVNGMGVQMLNFESNFFTKQENIADTEIKNKNIRLLATGYQLTDRVKAMSTTERDVILIMRGDGSVINLKNINTQCSNDSNCYIGDYYSDNKASYVRAKVEFIEGFSWPEYRNRRATVMMGDGLSYIYEEQKINYYDYPMNTGSWFLRPQVFILKKIKDRFGNVLDLTYVNNLVFGGTQTYVYGRPLITSISGSWPGSNASFQYSKGAFGVVVTSSSGKYKIQTEEFDFGFGDIHRPMVTKITNPFGNECTFTNEEYDRTATDINNPLYRGAPDPQTITLKFENSTGLSLQRMISFTNYNGGTKQYTYIGGGSNLSIDMKPGENQKIQSENYFYGQGRDAFFSNMVASVSTKVGSSEYSTEEFTYPYTDINSDRLTNPVDELDSCHTKRVKNSSSSTYNYETPPSFTSLYSYKNYKLHSYVVNVENPDWPGETKLSWEQHFTDYPDSMFKGVNYQYHTGNASGGVYGNGSFLMHVVKEQLGSALKIDSFLYTYTDDILTINEFDTPVKEKTETDMYGLKTITTFDTTVYQNSIHYKWAKYNAYENLQNQEYDTTFVYFINVPVSVEKYKGNTLLQKQVMNYFSANNDGGYIQQMIYSRIYDVNNLSYYLENQYKYYRNDTTGKMLYPTYGTKPSVEGNLKEIINPKGQSTKYYYHPVQSSSGDPNAVEDLDGPVIPKLKAIKLFDNNSIEYELHQWEDKRLPTRIDSYIDGSRYVSNFNMYDYKGNVSKNVNPNLYLSEFTYDDIGRIKHIILPYDYDTEQLQDSVYYDTTYVTASYVFPSNLWGYVNTLNGVSSSQPHPADMANLFNTSFHDNGGGIDNITSSILGFTDFDNTALMNSLNSFVNIESATLEYYPSYLNCEVDGNPAESLFYVKIRSLTSRSSSSHTFSNYSKNAPVFLNLSSTTCTNFNNTAAWVGNYNIVDVTNIMRGHISTTPATNFKGFVFDQFIDLPNPYEYPEIDVSFHLGYCVGNNYPHWPRPVLKISGIIRDIDTIIFKRFSNSTFKYIYDDANNSSEVYSKIDKQGSNYRYKRSGTQFDPFYRVSQKKSYTHSTSAANVTNINYNYLDKKAQIVDSAGNTSKFSYDKYGQASYTENPDNSINMSSNEFLGSLSTYFYSVSGGYINKQTYTDETNRQFEKYIDGAGRLLREVKYVLYQQSVTNPQDPDTNISGQDAPPSTPVYTDYKYDDLYRVIEVRTPNGKHIYYQYDGLGRQTQRTTPDAGITKYWYDRNGNLTYSQDEIQRDASPQKYTLRTYDGMNRLLTISEETPYDPNQEEDNPTTGNTFIVNCYDSLAFAPLSGIFTNIPTDFQPNAGKYNTKGSLVASAYKTQLTDSWNYKFYRYDARGRVIKFWHYIAGLGWKTENYSYNSQNQLKSNWYQPNKYDSKLFVNSFDGSARLSDVSLYTGNQPSNQEGDDSPSSYLGLTSYIYNYNSQVAVHYMNGGQLHNSYTYNNRNWIQLMTSNPGLLFKYYLQYNPNGNIRRQVLQGSYKNSFSDNSELWCKYYYDQSNRLIFADDENGSGNSRNLGMTYDNDGNITEMQRYGSSNNLVDNFNYEYFSGTNRLKYVTGTKAQYSYDSNGNVTKDLVNNNHNILYDYRNLMTDIRTIRTEISESEPIEITYWTQYKYDESGNRVRKQTWKYLGTQQDPIYNEEDGPTVWQQITNEFYVRDAAGKEIAIYNDTTLSFWNIWGSDNVGKINSDTTKNYYLKDHLGSIRATINSTNTVISAQDYDAWGYVMENRNYNTTNLKYSFSSNEKDNETNYNYTGIRYYNSRIARWGSVEILLNKFISYSPYSYSVLNPVTFTDQSGFGPKLTITGNASELYADVGYVTKKNDATNGLDSKQIEVMNLMLEDMKTWSMEAEIKGKNLDIKMNLNKVKGSEGQSYEQLLLVISSLKKGFIMFKNAVGSEINKLEPNSGIGIEGSVILLGRGDMLKYKKASGAHELGHGMGLTEGDRDPEKKSAAPSVMEGVIEEFNKFGTSLGEQRDPPTEWEWQQIFERQNIDPYKDGTYDIINLGN